MSLFIISNKVTEVPANSNDTFLAIEDLQTEVTLADGRVVQNCALTIQGAKFVDGGISIAIDLDMVVAYGDEYMMADGRHQHAGSAIIVSDEDVNAQTWERLVKYADACTSFTFSGRRLQLGNKAYFFNFLVGKKDAYVAFDIVKGEGAEVDGVSYDTLVITEFSMSENASVGISESAEAKTGTVNKTRANPFAPAATLSPKPALSINRVPSKIAAQ